MSGAALILIVDDDVDFLAINRHILEKAGYRVRTATTPHEAATAVEKERPNLVISDLMMTSIDAGFSLARTLKEDARFAGIPVIISTSVSSQLGLDFRPRSAEDLAKMNIDAYFDKPIDAEALLAKVAELLGGRRPAGRPAPADRDASEEGCDAHHNERGGPSS